MTRQLITPSEAMPTTVILYYSGTAGETKQFNFLDGSITYYEKILRNSFSYTLIDNIGTGSIRVSYNRPTLDISNYVNGAKTLKTQDTFYIEEEISYLTIYFIQNSNIEIVLKSAKDLP
jgi:hypothetical protein